MLDRHCPIIDLFRLIRRKVNRRAVQPERGDFTLSFCSCVEVIVPRVCAREAEICIVDPVLLHAAVNHQGCAVTVDVCALEHFVMRGKADGIARNDRTRLKADPQRGNIRRPVIFFCYLVKRTRKILRCDLSRRRKL